MIRHIKSILHMHCLQDDLDKLQDLEQNWDMEFHPQKCKLLSITKSGFDVPFRRDLRGAVTKVPQARAQNGYQCTKGRTNIFGNGHFFKILCR